MIETVVLRMAMEFSNMSSSNITHDCAREDSDRRRSPAAVFLFTIKMCSYYSFILNKIFQEGSCRIEFKCGNIQK